MRKDVWLPVKGLTVIKEWPYLENLAESGEYKSLNENLELKHSVSYFQRRALSCYQIAKRNIYILNKSIISNPKFNLN